jgi:menaquinone-dependent protoporphyrinogen oxidase
MPRRPRACLLVHMNASILVAYATKHGSTEQVAGKVAARLSANGFVADVRAAHDVIGFNGYDGVILGSAIYMGRLHPDAREFLQGYPTGSTALPIAVFAMGPRTLAERDLASSRAQLDAALAKEQELRPFATAIFGGVFDPAHQHFPFNRLPASDARDWKAIEAWADGVAARFTLSAAAA